MNPLFRSKSVDQFGAKLTMETIASMMNPPSAEMWEEIRGIVVDLSDRVNSLSKEVLDLRRSATGSGVTSASSILAMARSERSPVTGMPKSRKTFQQKNVYKAPVTPGDEGPDSVVVNPLHSPAPASDSKA